MENLKWFATAITAGMVVGNLFTINHKLSEIISLLSK